MRWQEHHDHTCEPSFGFRTLHTVQDAQAAGRQFQECNGHLTLSHEYHDFFRRSRSMMWRSGNRFDLLRNVALNQDFTMNLYEDLNCQEVLRQLATDGVS